TFRPGRRCSPSPQPAGPADRRTRRPVRLRETTMSSGQLGRRAFLRRCGTSAMVLGAAGAGAVGGVGVPALTPTRRALAATPSTYDYTARATYDSFDRAFHESG